MTASTVQLSQWWRSDSCKRAFKRVESQRRERIAKLKLQLEQKKQEQQHEIDNWKEQN